ncbi:hypothetical protein MRX96_034139 [Rhipicephalus microplus]
MKGKKRRTATPAPATPRPSTKGRKPQQSDPAGADGTAHETSAVASGKSSATVRSRYRQRRMACYRRQQRCDMATSVARRPYGNRIQRSNDRILWSKSDAKNHGAGAVPKQPTSVFFRVLSGT